MLTLNESDSLPAPNCEGEFSCEKMVHIIRDNIHFTITSLQQPALREKNNDIEEGKKRKGINLYMCLALEH